MFHAAFKLPAMCQSCLSSPPPQQLAGHLTWTGHSGCFSHGPCLGMVPPPAFHFPELIQHSVMGTVMCKAQGEDVWPKVPAGGRFKFHTPLLLLRLCLKVELGQQHPLPPPIRSLALSADIKLAMLGHPSTAKARQPIHPGCYLWVSSP